MSHAMTFGSRINPLQLVSRLLDVDPEEPDRWWTRFVFWHCILVLLWIAAGLIFTANVDIRYTRNPPPPARPGEPQQHPMSSLGIIHHYWTDLVRVEMPWWVLGVVFAALALGLLHPRTRATCYYLAALASAVFEIVLVEFTYASGNSTNQITVPLSTLAPDAFLAGWRYAKLPATPRRVRR